MFTVIFLPVLGFIYFVCDDSVLTLARCLTPSVAALDAQLTAFLVVVCEIVLRTVLS